MSELHQSGLHPDADQLSAFVEHALPPHEREQTLAHLASCSACRAIVSLSLPPAAEAAHPQAEPARRPSPLGWFHGWNLAWPVAVAFAALVPLVLYLHRTAITRNRNAEPSEIAESRPALLTPPASTPPPNVPSPHAPMEKSGAPPAAAASPAGKRPEMAAQPPPSPIVSAQIVAGGAAVSSLTPAAGSPQPPAASPGAVRFSAGLGGSGGSGGSRPATPDQGNSGIYGGTGQANLNENYVAAVPAASPPPLPPAAAASAAATSVTVTNAPPMLDTSDATLGGLLSAAAPQAPLPRGLPALSTATRGRLVLALDTANTLFISEDAGHSWKPVPAQWKGRVVSVKLAATPVALARGAAQAAVSGLAGFSAGALKATPRQDSGVSGVAGVVSDPTGAVVPDASIVVTDAAKQVFRNARTDAAGHYRIDGLTPGSYQLEARSPGFQTLTLAVNVAPSQQSSANLTLQVGAATETVTVTAAPAFETDESAHDVQAQKKAALAAPIQPTLLFEITTESGERWVSPDGQTWSRRP